MSNSVLNASNNLSSRLIVALDFDNARDCMAMVERLSPDNCRVKIGKELFTSCGPSIVSEVQNKGFDVFLDLKFHDIPNTVAKAVKAAAELGVWMVNVHASGGPRMLEEAANIIANKSEKPYLIGVTVLTSMEQSELDAIGLMQSPLAQVVRLARLSKSTGLDGVVSSAHEVTTIKQACGADFLCVTPGIRPSSAALDDQRRIMTPADAVEKGSDYLVVGRPITRSDDPLKSAGDIDAEIKSALSRFH